MTKDSPAPRLAIDIGGTFTDVVLDLGDDLATAKVLAAFYAAQKNA